MKLKIVKDSWEAKGRTFYCIRYVILDEKDNIVRKGQLVTWLTEEQYNSIKL